MTRILSVTRSYERGLCDMLAQRTERQRRVVSLSERSAIGVAGLMSTRRNDVSKRAVHPRPGAFTVALAGAVTASLAALIAVPAPTHAATPKLSLSSHTLALSEDGTIWSWGDNGYGQLGTGDSGGSRNSPLQVKDPDDTTAPLTHVVDVTAGEWHSLAVKNDGTVWAWGRNQSGQLGTGDRDMPALPEKVVGENGIDVLADVKDVGAGWGHTVASTNGGEVWAWGSGTLGKLGNGSTQSSDVPVKALISGADAIAVGNHYTLALKDGTVWAWGQNSVGQLGNGKQTDWSTASPVQVVDPSGDDYLTNVSAISAGRSHSIALKGDGTVWAWGGNTCNDSGAEICGQLGNSAVGQFSTVPVQVEDSGDATGYLTDVIAIAAGNAFSLALKEDRTVWAWGRTEEGELVMANTGAPITGVISIAAGLAGSAAIREDGTIWTWTWGQPAEQVGDLNLDATPPSVTFSPHDGVYGPSVTVTLEAEDTVDPSPTILYTTDESDPRESDTAESLDGSGVVTITKSTILKFVAVDAAGRESPVETVEYLIGPTSIARVSETEEDNRVFVDHPIALDGSDSSDPDEDPLTYSWSIMSTDPAGRSGTFETPTGTTTTFTPGDWGTYVLELTVDDGLGGTDTATVNIVAETTPTSAFEYASTGDDPDQLLIGTPIQFTDLSEDPDSEGDRDGWTWIWDFGDGTASSEQNPSHEYGEAGIYHATLAVVDQDGHESETVPHHIVAVGAPWAPVTWYDSWEADSDPYMIDVSADYGIVLTKYGNGTPLVTLAEYGGNPTGGDVFQVANRFFDVNLRRSVGVDEVTFTVSLGTSDPTGFTLAWFNPDEGRWSRVEQQTLTGDAESGYAIDVTLNRTESSPTVQQLTGTIFAVGLNAVPNVTLLTPQGDATWRGVHDIQWDADDPDSDSELITIELSYAPVSAVNGDWNVIATGESNDGVYTWDTSEVPRAGLYQVQVTVADGFGGEATATSDPFLINQVQGVAAGPNPASDSVTFYFSPDAAGTLYVYDAAGRLVWSDETPSGSTSRTWNLVSSDGEPLANGLYLYRLVGDDGDGGEIGKLVVVR